MSATNRGSTRAKNDFYATPNWCVNSLLPLIDMNKVSSFYEPCVGDGAIYNLINIPEANKYWSEIRLDKDYLKGEHEQVDLIITNPPYSQAQEFIEKSFTHASNVIMLLRLNYLESGKRHTFWQKHKPDHLIILSNRPSFTGKGTDATAYAWFVWGDVLKDKAPFQWITKGVNHANGE